MEFYFIPPLANLNLMHKGDRYFCLAQLYLTDENYRQFFNYLPENAWITLDNGAGDHDLVTEDMLFQVMSELNPNEVIPPDILMNGPKTIDNAKSFHDRMVAEELDHIEIFFCPQGDTQKNWLYCYEWALEQDWITTIGLSKIGVPWAFLMMDDDRGIMEARHNCFNYLKVNGLLQKPLHLLGMGDPREFAYYMQFEEAKWIRSSDSCNAIWSAMNRNQWSLKMFQRIPTPKDYFQREVKNKRIFDLVTQSNIEYLRASVA
jgi:hypothetical protein